MDQITRVLSAIEHGDAGASSELLPLVYQELRRMAARKLAKERPGQTLQPTALVHEAYMRLVGGDSTMTSWSSRKHFFVAAAEAMRRILVERARRKRRVKHGGKMTRIHVSPGDIAAPEADAHVLAIDELLEQMESQFPDKAALVKLRFFAGLTIIEAADALGISTATAQRHWRFARTWLFSELNDGSQT
jgi:RNA polymerase sigma factor (TIGR02999 family)